MLALERPLGVAGSLALFGDHADPKRVYYVPTRPQLALAGTTQELSFVKFRADDAADGGVGLLSFTTELVASDADLQKAKELVVRQGITEPVFVQVPWTGGKAVLAAAIQEGDEFVEQMIGEVTAEVADNTPAIVFDNVDAVGVGMI